MHILTERKSMSKEDFTTSLRETYNTMLLNKEQTAKELNISQATLDRLRKSGGIKGKKVCGQIMFKIDEVARYIES